ncbi:MAG: hypothetical protein A2084_01635 [Tenericutes bacterium GWC2_39_45]|nr:MAG: hypothetical protein A2Y43_03890 [Tenericutes bacterium GWA2_38_26]OHE31197.1 MAG: hypothetical protein A2084_01635 [Tenericutes bacterium GWC2_39_45]OHE31671.1 MAG: hypothetical protein A2009_01750 [Tenericutes bacterium GWD2_38_27]
MSNLYGKTTPQYPPKRYYLIHERNKNDCWHRHINGQEKVAAACGISRVAYGNIENGKQNMTLLTAIKIAQHLEIQFQDFCKEELSYQESKDKFAKKNGQSKK